MNVICYKCGRTENKSRDELIELGWAGSDGQINGQKIKFEACPEHSNGDDIAKEVIRRFKKRNPKEASK
jgi:hypothetical protein